MEPVIQPRRWTRSEYYRLAEEGFFRPDERLELLDGEIVTMTPQGGAHASVVQILVRRLIPGFGDDFLVRGQAPLALAEASELEPDVAVVKGATWDFVAKHPQTAELVIEVADISLGKDRLRKAPLYAQARIPEYWIIDLAARQLEVYRDPLPTAGGGTYQTVRQMQPGDTISPVAKPEIRLAVADLLPPPQ